MKYLKNHHYVLVAHFVISVVSLLLNFSVIGVISISLVLLYFMLIKYISRNRTANYFAQLIIFTTIPFCYTTTDLIEKYFHTDWGSVVPLIMIFIAFYIALRIPNTRKESVLNVRSRYTEDDSEIRRKANVFVSKTLYISLVPQFILTLYFTWVTKLGISISLLMLTYILAWMYTSHIGRKKIIKLQHSENN